jgi:hypothetical protein
MAATVQLIGTAECLQTDGGTVLATSDGVYDTEHTAVRDVQRLERVVLEAGIESADAA